MKVMKSNPYRARKAIAFFVLFNLSLTRTIAQPDLPMIKANSTSVKVKDGYVIREGIWTLSPELKPDIYHVLSPDIKHEVTFYTDIDSISFQVVPGKTYDFVTLLNGKDSCFTKISATESVKNNNDGIFADHLIGAEKLAMDFVVFRDYLQREHPGLYRYKSKERIKSLFDSCLISISGPQTKLDFAKNILFINSAIKDGHTGSNISSILVKSYLESTKLFPLYLYFVDNRAFICCANTDGFPVGTEILAIENKSVTEVRKRLFAYLPADGSIETKKIQTLNNNGAFPFLYRWIFGPADSFSVTYKNIDGEIKKVQVPASLASDFECEREVARKNTPVLSLEYPKNDVGLLTIKTFDKNRLGGNQQFEKFLAKSFAELHEKNVKSLIIDLRDNAGGQDEYGSLLYSYLASKPFRYYASIESTAKVFREEENQMLGIIPPQINVFSGNVLILINGLSFSVTAEFCAIAKSNGRALFVGEETGGGYHGNTSGQTMKIELPNSLLQVIIPRFKYVNYVEASKHSDRGIIPDYQIYPNVQDYINGTDVILEYALALTAPPKK